MSDEIRVRQHARRKKVDTDYLRAMPQRPRIKIPDVTEEESEQLLKQAIKNLQKAQEAQEAQEDEDGKPPRRTFTIPDVPARPRRKEVVKAAKVTVKTAKKIIKQRKLELSRSKAECKVVIQDAQADIGEAKVALSRAKEALKRVKSQGIIVADASQS